MSLFRSENSETRILVLASGQMQRLTGVKVSVDSVGYRAAVWTAELVLVGTVVQMDLVIGVINETSGDRQICPSHRILNGTAGQRYSVSGVVMREVQEGDVYGLYAGTSTINLVSLAVNGLRVLLM